MTIRNSKTWIKLNQIDCERRFNLNLNSHRKDTAEEDRDLFTSAATNLAFSHQQRLFWSLTLDLSYSWNTIHA